MLVKRGPAWADGMRSHVQVSRIQEYGFEHRGSLRKRCAKAAWTGGGIPLIFRHWLVVARHTAELVSTLWLQPTDKRVDLNDDGSRSSKPA